MDQGSPLLDPSSQIELFKDVVRQSISYAFFAAGRSGFPEQANNRSLPTRASYPTREVKVVDICYGFVPWRRIRRSYLVF